MDWGQASNYLHQSIEELPVRKRKVPAADGVSVSDVKRGELIHFVSKSIFLAIFLRI